MANEQNLIPNEARTPEERRENARKAGVASGKARRQKRTLRSLVLPLADDWNALSVGGRQMPQEHPTHAKKLHRTQFKHVGAQNRIDHQATIAGGFLMPPLFRKK